jgi:hypothetical protein
MARASLKHLLEDAEVRVQRGQRNIDRQREAISALERDGHLVYAEKSHLPR